ncbi:MAG: 3-dehydroquinate synthase [Alphaproteobacteria bacterium MarineAlpha2_Bin1]|nr:MAG: 3-dehydroquinate synthase [Alphaproteobacteria bacterium MarineAlpha2_Bin1]|tara:strand:- start:1679 stop:2785 length:1107 start_codon:yes stop_codon:yes gene_type:complete
MDNKVKVYLDNNRSYQIIIGYENLNDLIDFLIKNYTNSKIAIITDDNVAKLYLESLLNALSTNKFINFKIIIPAGENSKSYKYFKLITDSLLENKIQRDDVILSLGGGVVGDIAGFAAGVIRRGVNIIHIPTTLIAQVDSSIGGKTGIDTSHGKNLLGIFHQPKMVLVNTKYLITLSKRDFLSGYAEILKYALINDINFFEWLENNYKNIISCQKKELEFAIKKCCLSKANIVSEDETELSGKRILLNLGHTFGHAIENALKYDDKLKHGEAVAIGIRLAYELSLNKGLCTKEDLCRVKNHLLNVGLPINLDHINNTLSIDDLYLPMLQDKKNKDGKTVFILAKRIGKALPDYNVTEEEVKEVLAKLI